MANFLFWNVNARPRMDLIRELVHFHAIDILMLAECKELDDDILNNLNASQDIFKKPRLTNSKFCKIFYRASQYSLETLESWPRYPFYKLKSPVGNSVLLVVSHLPSKRYSNDDNQASHCAVIADHIKKRESTLGHTRTLVVGDLNMNPFEKGMIDANGFHAVSTRDIADTRSRIVQGQKYEFFFNPMWRFFGDASPGPPGSYYYPDSGYISYFWHIFDQVLLRPALLPFFKDNSLRILTKVGSISLLKNNIPDRNVGSDHLPILFSLNL